MWQELQHIPRSAKAYQMASFFSFLFCSFSVVLCFFLKDPQLEAVEHKILISFCIYTLYDFGYILTKGLEGKQHFARSHCKHKSCCSSCKIQQLRLHTVSLFPCLSIHLCLGVPGFGGHALAPFQTEMMWA